MPNAGHADAAPGDAGATAPGVAATAAIEAGVAGALTTAAVGSGAEAIGFAADAAEMTPFGNAAGAVSGTKGCFMKVSTSASCLCICAAIAGVL